ncbi:13411_t:CDS:2 [Acaulospora colombiana]|uniref:13411_t:CDS:1 n=1 Tax=Acaulospora colombiana TaxID=27376 RepID=A0ACA9KEY9_9GLOM|nr:13411_t:CDS:2 [Acaulospora colombiana]
MAFKSAEEDLKNEFSGGNGGVTDFKFQKPNPLPSLSTSTYLSEYKRPIIPITLQPPSPSPMQDTPPPPKFDVHFSVTTITTLIIAIWTYLNLSSSFNTAAPQWVSTSSQVPLEVAQNAAFRGGSGMSSIFLTNGLMMTTSDGDSDSDIGMTYQFTPENQVWTLPSTSGASPERRVKFQYVSDNNAKLYIFGGYKEDLSNNTGTGILTNEGFNDIFVFDSVALSWTQGSSVNAPPPISNAASVMLNDGRILFIGGRVKSKNTWVDASMSQIPTYDTKLARWSTMTTGGATIIPRSDHTAVITPGGQILIFGGVMSIFKQTPVPPLVVLDTTTKPFNYTIPQVKIPPNALVTNHTAIIYQNYMFVIFGSITHNVSTGSTTQSSQIYALDYTTLSWVTDVVITSSNIKTSELLIISVCVTGALIALAFFIIGLVYYRKYKLGEVTAIKSNEGEKEIKISEDYKEGEDDYDENRYSIHIASIQVSGECLEKHFVRSSHSSVNSGPTTLYSPCSVNSGYSSSHTPLQSPVLSVRSSPAFTLNVPSSPSYPPRNALSAPNSPRHAPSPPGYASSVPNSPRRAPSPPEYAMSVPNSPMYAPSNLSVPNSPARALSAPNSPRHSKY